MCLKTISGSSNRARAIDIDLEIITNDKKVNKVYPPPLRDMRLPDRFVSLSLCFTIPDHTSKKLITPVDHFSLSFSLIEYDQQQQKN
jgi:hypothetical protein